jgi:plastocyanin
MRKLPVAALIAVMSALLASQALAATRNIVIGDDYYVRKGSPPTVTVKRGTTVKWRWVGRDPHNVTVTKGPVKFRSKLKDSGSFSRTVNRTGTYKIHCTIHQPDMRMTLKVVR